MVHRYVWDNGHRLTIQVNFMVKCMWGLWIQWFHDQAHYSLIDGYYKTYIINGVGHPRLDLVVPLVLYTIAFNMRGTDVVL
jgi:hypothetical protein